MQPTRAVVIRARTTEDVYSITLRTATHAVVAMALTALTAKTVSVDSGVNIQGAFGAP